MAHLGILFLAADGHLNPMTALEYELRQRGHRVTVIGFLDAEPKVLAAGTEQFEHQTVIDTSYRFKQASFSNQIKEKQQ